MNCSNVFNFFSEVLMKFSESHPVLPVFSKNELINLCKESKNIFIQEQTQIILTGDFIIVGDLHGHVFDLFNIFQQYGLPPKQRFIFLGDIVDRGNYSLSVTTLIFALKTEYPDYVYLLRGNHEFRSVCSNSGFFDEIMKIYKKEDESNAIFDAFIDAFNSLPLVACVNNNYICVHGGIGPKFQKIDQLKNIVRPLNEIYGGIADEILWSDPSDDIDLYRASSRGVGYEFGHSAINNFLKANRYRLLIRAHQQIQDGFEYSLDNRVLTVFSASNYCGEYENFGGIVLIKENAEKEEPVKIENSLSVMYESVTFINSEERSFDLLKVNKKKRSRSKSFRISSGKSTSSLPSFLSSKKKFRHDQSKSSKLLENFDIPSFYNENGHTTNEETTGESDNINCNDEIEIDPNLDSTSDENMRAKIESGNNAGPKKTIQSLQLNINDNDNINQWDNPLMPKSLSARAANSRLNTPFSIRSRKAGPIVKKYNFM